MPTRKTIRSGMALEGNFAYHSRARPGDPLIPINPEGRFHAWHCIQSTDYSERKPADAPKVLVGFFRNDGGETWSCRIRSYPYDRVYVHRKTLDHLARLLGMVKINRGEWALEAMGCRRKAGLTKPQAASMLEKAGYRPDPDDPDVFTHTGLRYKTIVLDESPTSHKMVEHVRAWLAKNPEKR